MLLQVAVELEKPINEYFDNVFVMSEDENVKQNRLAGLQQLARLSSGIVDLSSLPGY